MKIQPKLVLLALLLTLSLGLFTASPVLAGGLEQQVQFVAPRLVVNSSFLNVRTGPGVQYPVLITVVGGTQLPVLARASDNVWFQVTTVVGVGWVNIQYTIPRGSFDNVPTVRLSDIVAAIVPSNVPTTLGLPDGQGGGGPAPVFSNLSSTTPTASGTIRLTYDGGRKVTTVAPGERFRAVINVEAVNLRTAPSDQASSLGTLFGSSEVDYPILGSATGENFVEWIAIESADLGVGWIEAPKAYTRLSRVSGHVLVVTAGVVGMTDSANGSGNNLPILSQGQEGFMRNATRDITSIQLELPDGTLGWVPASSVVERTGTPTDLVDLSQIPQVAIGATANVTAGVVNPAGVTTTSGPASFGLDVPHIVINTGFLNIRSGPGAQYTTVATLPGGTELPVLGMAKDRVWYLVQGPFGRGWINIEFALFRGSIDTVPIIHDAAIGTLATPVALVSDTVTLYAAPGTNFGTIGSIGGPVELSIVARTADSQWLQLNTSLGFGWVVASQVLVRGDLSLIPIVE